MQGVIFMRYGTIPGMMGAPSQQGDGCTPAVNRLQHRALGLPLHTPAPTPNPCPEHPVSEAFLVSVAMETPSHSAGPG